MNPLGGVKGGKRSGGAEGPVRAGVWHFTGVLTA
jgi:hypothetical protein